ncbi:MAG: TatD family hydrolase [Bacteroidales bacterium]
MIPFPHRNDLIDLHTHKMTVPAGVFAITNLFVQDIHQWPPGHGTAFSTGIHPWHLEQVDRNSQLRKLESLLNDPMVVAVGEAGLDRGVDIPFELQTSLFLEQVHLAEKAGKPMIIHCVRTYSDLLDILNQQTTRIPLIIHGFRGTREMAGRLIEKGAYLSFGHSLLHPASRQAVYFGDLPAERVFFETDMSPLGIRDLYKRASDLKGWSLDEWVATIHNNYSSCFSS